MQKSTRASVKTLIGALRSVLISHVTLHDAAGMPRQAARE
jgi:hypothetical protein